MTVCTDDEMIVHRYVEFGGDADKAARSLDIRLARPRIAGRVIMRQQKPPRPEPQSVTDYCAQWHKNIARFSSV